MLITSISGIRGTIGGFPGESLTPRDIVQFTAGYGKWLLGQSNQTATRKQVVVGRDARTSGSIISNIVCATLQSMGIDILDLGPVPTPTIEMWVIKEGAIGGIVITASHNPIEYNGLKLLNRDGEFLSADDWNKVLAFSQDQTYAFASAHDIGTYQYQENAIDYHVQQILKLPFLNISKIRDARLVVAFDAINSVGGIAVPQLLKSLNVVYIPLHDNPNGLFAHNPEPLEKNLTELKSLVSSTGAHLGIAVDPDVDRLVLVDERGDMFGEEYTLVAVADVMLESKKGTVVTNLSSSQALDDLAKYHHVNCYRSAVGEKNVVTKMKEVSAIIGGEGSGGVIVPELHYGRDALVGIALILHQLVSTGKTLSEIRANYANYYMAKEKIDLYSKTDLSIIFKAISDEYNTKPQNKEDGLWIATSDHSWVHLRPSNTEPIIRIYTEASNQAEADILVQKIKTTIQDILALGK